jgi:hypothetical protein
MLSTLSLPRFSVPLLLRPQILRRGVEDPMNGRLSDLSLHSKERKNAIGGIVEREFQGTATVCI